MSSVTGANMPNLSASRFDVAIIGAGIVGCACAYYLAKKGLSVIVLEKGSVGCEQSSRNLGFVRQQGRDLREIPLMAASKRLWRGLQEELEADLEWRQGGVLYVADSTSSIEGYETWLNAAGLHQLDSRLLSGPEVSDLLPTMSKRWLGGLYTPSDGQANPARTTRAFADAARRLGATFLSGLAAEKLDLRAARVVGVATENGIVQASNVLVAAGAWSSKLLRLSGLGFPQLAVRSTVMRTKPVKRLTELCFWGPKFGFRQQPDGSVIIGAGVRCDHDVDLDSVIYAPRFWNTLGVQKGKVDLHFSLSRLLDVGHLFSREESFRRALRTNRVLDPSPIDGKVKGAFEGFKGLFPDLDVEIEEAWAGMIDVTPDEVPVLGPVDRFAGLFVAAGFSGHGFGIGPAAGLAAAEMIANGKTSIDIKDFSVERFR